MVESPIQKMEQVDFRQDLRELQRSLSVGFDKQNQMSMTAVAVLADQIRTMQSEIVSLRKEINVYRCLDVSDGVAREIVLELLKKKKDSGITNITAFDIQDEANLPLEQIGKIIDTLTGEGKLKAQDE